VEIGAQIPDEVWATVPDDASINYKHYLYGAPKKQACTPCSLRKPWHTMTISTKQGSFLSCVTVRGKPCPGGGSPADML
jgi:hypothetical protein